VLQIIKLMRY